jgi:hypothetical protein
MSSSWSLLLVARLYFTFLDAGLPLDVGFFAFVVVVFAFGFVAATFAAVWVESRQFASIKPNNQANLFLCNLGTRCLLRRRRRLRLGGGLLHNLLCWRRYFLLRCGCGCRFLGWCSLLCGGGSLLGRSGLLCRSRRSRLGRSRSSLLHSRGGLLRARWFSILPTLST